MLTSMIENGEGGRGVHVLATFHPRIYIFLNSGDFFLQWYETDRDIRFAKKE